MAVNKEIADIGNDLLSQISSDDQDHEELGGGLDDQSQDQQQNDKFQNEFEDNDDDSSDSHDASDLGDDAPKKDKGSKERTQAKPDQQQQQRDTGAVEDIFDGRVRLKQDRAGNLLNSAGQIVVRAGRERKFFEDAKKRVVAEQAQNVKLAGTMQKIAGAAKELHNRFVNLQEQKGMFEKAGLNNEEQLQMLQIATEFKRNPVDGIKKLLTMAHLQGVDLKTLGVAGGIDARTIASEIQKSISEQLKPITERETATKADRTAFEEAKRTAEEFFADNPDALEAREKMGVEAFNQVIFSAKQRFPKMSLNEIWLRIKLGATNAPQQRQGQERQQDRRRTTEDVGNRRRPQRSRNSANESFDDIGRSVLRDLQTSLRE